MPWARHVTRCRPVIRRTFEVADNTGDRFLAVAGGNILLSNLLLAGDPLVEVEREAEVCLAFCRTGSYGDYTDALRTQAALVRSLRGLTPQFGLFDDEQFDERRIENGFATQPHIEAIECWYWIRKLQARFLAGALRSRPRGLAARARPPDEVAGHARTGRARALQRPHPCRPVRLPIERRRPAALWRRSWPIIGSSRCGPGHCPENFENRLLLVAAEIARIEGRDPDAMRLYEQAVRSARDNGFVNNEALALEIAARFYAGRGLDRIARAYLRDARNGYRQWGADGKVRQLEEQYPYLTDEHASSDPTRTRADVG